MPVSPHRLLPGDAVSCWGVLTEGPVGGWPSRLRQALLGRGVSNLGIGGQTAV